MDKLLQKQLLIAGMIAGIIVIIVLSINETSPSVPNSNSGKWQASYQALAQEKLPDYNENVQNTPYYDYENPLIVQAADNIAKTSTSSKDAIEKTLQYVYDNVEYVVGESDQSCFAGTAPIILASGKGQCDTQSIVVISMLRRMGIAAQPVGGCVIVNSQSCALQAMFLQSFQAAGGAPIYTEANVTSGQTEFSRTSISSRKGGLHAWVTAWDSESQSWLTLEETTGKLANEKCYYYHVELYPTNNDKQSICVSTDYNYAKACQMSDLESLDKYGLGLSNSAEGRP